MLFTTTLLMGISLSLDAFSLSLAYGLMNFPNKKILLVSSLVGIFHFFMPIFGLLIGNKLINIIKIDTKYIITIIFVIIILEMIKSLKNEKVESSLKLKETFLFAFAVSLDSFSVGIALGFLKADIIQSCLTFTVCSFIFTLFGFKLGKFLNQKIGKLSKIISIILLTLLLILFLLKN